MDIRRKTYTLAVLIISFSVLTFFVIKNNIFVTSLDSSVYNFFANNQSPIISKLMLSITRIGDVYEALTIFFVFGIFLILKHKKHFHAFAIATFLGAIVPFLIKSLVVRIRPSLLLEQDYSFPSAHATIATVFLLSSIFFLAPHIKKVFSRNAFILSTSVIFPLVAFSRIYLSAHWTTDVIAGIILGSICFVSCELLSCYKKENVL